MRRDPDYSAFTIAFPADEESEQMIASLRRQIAPDAELVDTCVSSEGTQTVHYRIGDFFEEIVLLPDADGKANQFRLVFHRRANAGRFWKDIMVRIVRLLETEWSVSVSLDYQGDVPLNWMRPHTIR